MADRYSKNHEDSLCLFDGAYEALDNLKSLDIRLAVITNGTSEQQRGKINRFGINHFFDLFLIDEEVGLSKPDLQIFKMALEKLSLNSTDVWMVGDNLAWDVGAAQKIGIYAVWNDFRKKGLPKDSLIIPDKTIVLFMTCR